MFHTFSLLPTEISLNILECTDLLTPTREATWDPIAGYKAPLRGRLKNRSWKPPGALFLVNKAFYAQAREVFFKHNRIVVWPHGNTFSKLSGSPSDYAATTFFADVLTAGTFFFLRHLELPALVVIGVKGKEAEDQAQSNWVRALGRMYDNGGLDNLRFLRITGSWDGAPNPDSFLSRILNPAIDLTIMRNFVKDHVWPFIEHEHGPPRLPRKLVVEMQGWMINHSRYSIRRKGEHSYERVDPLFVGEPTLSRFISWKPSSQHHNQGHWAEDAQDGEWIEEAWLQAKVPPRNPFTHPLEDSISSTNWH
ncbi:hypothetical protein F4679DRAFT_544002 [Xylaria curta]|nr:hypothetical protein F4679DRAFT_544002 [Xylaria curta]